MNCKYECGRCHICVRIKIELAGDTKYVMPAQEIRHCVKKVAE